MINGILLINKQKGITSYDVIRKLKKVLPKGQKIGHAGTLDPFATGLLIILLGKYTKQMVNILKMEKEYLVKAEFGYATDTQDVTGEKIKEEEDLEQIPRKRIEEVLNNKFTGVISQIPPQFSAKKIKGRKAYEYARAGKKVRLKPREIEVKECKAVNYNWPLIQFKVVCSSGTYVRTLINDLGEELKSYATAIELERVRIGDYTLDEALDSKDIVEGMDMESIKIIKYMEK
jgi:tRNA pseudouridine55 synthase